MIKRVIRLSSGDSTKNLIECLSKEFKDWQFRDMGSVARLRDSIHFHVCSSDKNVRGVLEITLAPSLGNGVELKVAKCRKTPWSMEALKAVEKYLMK